MADKYINANELFKRRYGCTKNCKSCDFWADGDSWCEGQLYVVDLLHVPAADVVPVRHGRWISDGAGKRFGTVVRLDKDGCPVDTCHCSECGEWLTASDEYPVIGRYCPNCGAKMDGEA